MHQADVLLYCCVVGGSHNTCDNTHNRFYSILFGTICISVSMWASRIAYSRLTKVLSAYELLLFLSSIFLCAPFDLHRSQHGSGCIGQKQIDGWGSGWVWFRLRVWRSPPPYCSTRCSGSTCGSTWEQSKVLVIGTGTHAMEIVCIKWSFPFPFLWFELRVLNYCVDYAADWLSSWSQSLHRF